MGSAGGHEWQQQPRYHGSDMVSHFLACFGANCYHPNLIIFAGLKYLVYEDGLRLSWSQREQCFYYTSSIPGLQTSTVCSYVASFLVLKILLCVKFCFQFPLAQKNGTYQQVWTLFDTKHGKKECAQQLFKQGYDLNPRDPMLLQAHSLCLSISVPTLGMTFLLSMYIPLIAALESKSQFQLQGWRPRLEGNQEQGKSLTTIDYHCTNFEVSTIEFNFRKDIYLLCFLFVY